MNIRNNPFRVGVFVLFFFMNCLCWNIRGIGKGEKTVSIRKLVETNSIRFMGLVETKHRKTISNRLRRIWEMKNMIYVKSFLLKQIVEV